MHKSTTQQFLLNCNGNVATKIPIFTSHLIFFYVFQCFLFSTFLSFLLFSRTEALKLVSHAKPLLTILPFNVSPYCTSHSSLRHHHPMSISSSPLVSVYLHPISSFSLHKPTSSKSRYHRQWLIVSSHTKCKCMAWGVHNSKGHQPPKS